MNTPRRVILTPMTPYIHANNVGQIDWSEVKRDFFHPFELDIDFATSYLRVPISSIVYPLCVIEDIGGDENMYVIILPKRHWSRYFGDQIVQSYNV